MRDTLIRLEDAEALRREGEALLCRVQGREVWVHMDRIAIDDDVIQRPGDRGRLTISREFAVTLGLV